MLPTKPGEPWNAARAVQIALSNDGRLAISLRWRDDQKRRAASRAVKKGWLRILGRSKGDIVFEVTADGRTALTCN